MNASYSELLFEPDAIDAVICLNGLVPNEEVFRTFANKPLIAADGAIVSILERGVQAEFVVGDMDSVPPELLADLAGVSELIRDPDQHTNDFEKAIRLALSQLWNNLMIVGMHGGDFEHTLNNWSVFMRFARTMKLSALELDRIAIPVFSSFTFRPNKNEVLSLVPQPHARISTKGLVWNLDNEELTLGFREGARNRAAADVVEITLHEGSLLFFCDARLPMMPVMN